MTSFCKISTASAKQTAGSTAIKHYACSVSPWNRLFEQSHTVMFSRWMKLRGLSTTAPEEMKGSVLQYRIGHFLSSKWFDSSSMIPVLRKGNNFWVRAGKRQFWMVWLPKIKSHSIKIWFTNGCCKCRTSGKTVAVILKVELEKLRGAKQKQA